MYMFTGQSTVQIKASDSKQETGRGRGEGLKQLKAGWTVVKTGGNVVKGVCVVCVFRCRQVAPVLSADGTWLQASSSCGSGAERNKEWFENAN